ncbi:protein of unknown function [Clostridium sp. USBA 49]|jgi:hypothetical protein|uniref:DUF4367 domain-containing protein n=1 Tax=Clostridium sp. USBA 49 TaxID=1881060 RepID=UPI00099B1648|nr:DUF4367 domain-containing protein [Clostridium sp. USBA 49]SKA86892.1 protein of unknown function [Clostridium sp. USBA 49]
MKILKNKNFIPLAVLTLIFVFGALLTTRGITFAKENIAKNTSTSDKPKTMESDKFNSKVKNLDNEDEVLKNINFKPKEPEYKYKNMKKVKVTGQKHSASTGSFDLSVSYYQTDDGKEIRIQQAPDTGKPEDTLARAQKISINGTDAWVYGNKNKQIMFWKDGIYYNIAAEDVELDELIKVASSLK